LTIKVDGDPADNKYKLVVGRTLKVTNFQYSWNRPALINNEYYYGNNEKTPINGFGWEIAAGGNIVPSAADEIIYVSGDIDFTNYEAALRTQGLHPASGVFLDHSQVLLALGSDPNIASNGIYDFILAYYNPASTGATPANDALKARLPSWPSSGLVFDGSQNGGLTSRNIGGIVANNTNRKGATGDSGQPNDNYVGNLTVPMANYMVSSLHVPEFKNTNIVGDGDRWANGVVNNYLTLVSTNNLGLVGDYSNFMGLSGSFDGITDIVGPLPETIGQGARKGYLNIWSNVTRETGIDRFKVVYVHGSGGEKIITGSTSDPTVADLVIIYSQKYNPSNAVHSIPYYRAFLDGTTPKIIPAGTTTPSIDAAYKGSSTTGFQQVPLLNEADWVAYMDSNNGAEPPLQSYSAAPKWDAEAFNALPVE
jgi:hypothetical protein